VIDKQERHAGIQYVGRCCKPAGHIHLAMTLRNHAWMERAVWGRARSTWTTAPCASLVTAEVTRGQQSCGTATVDRLDMKRNGETNRPGDARSTAQGRAKRRDGGLRTAPASHLTRDIGAPAIDIRRASPNTNEQDGSIKRDTKSLPARRGQNSFQTSGLVHDPDPKYGVMCASSGNVRRIALAPRGRLRRRWRGRLRRCFEGSLISDGASWVSRSPCHLVACDPQLPSH